MTAEADRTGRSVRSARLVTLVWLATTAFSSLLMPAVGVAREPDATVSILGAVGVLAVVGTQCGVLYGAVTPDWTAARRLRWGVAFFVAAAASLALVAPVAAGDWPTWAWTGAAIVGTVPLVVRPLRAVGVGLACVLAGVLVAVITGGSPLQAAVIVAGIGGSI